MRKIIGRGGGKGSSGGAVRTPVNDPDSLVSRAYAYVMDVVCEGEIEGLVNGSQSIYLDGTPVQAADGTDNFTGLKIESRNGLQAQEYIPEFPASENEVPVGVELVKDGTPANNPIPVVRQITNRLVDSVRVRISMPSMSKTDTTNGDVTKTSVRYTIELQSNGTGYNTIVDDEVIGKSLSKYERSYRIDLSGPGPWDIRVKRQTTNADAYTQNRTFWESYTEIIDGKFSYPNTALMALKIDSSQFTSIPTRGYDLKLLKIKIPSNATVRDDGSMTYSGTWDGTFQIAWSSNPAWVLYDVLTNTRYGLGGFIDSSLVDKWSLYSIGRYCDELVSDGKGGTEPRFSINCYLQTRQEAFKVISDIASAFRGMVYWSAGTITSVVDSPSDPVQLFTPANVVDGSFTYSGSSAKSRHTVAQVSWNDPDDLYRSKVEYVEDSEAIARYGVIEAQVVAFGCTSQSQANRVGRWLLYSERYQTEIVTFTTGINGASVLPGQVIKIADPVRAGSRRGGRIVSGTTTALVIDQALSIDPTTHTISVLLPDGTISEKGISSIVGTTINLASALSTAPDVGSIWMVASVAIAPQLFKVTSVVEDPDGRHQITALSHDAGKYDYVENGVKLEDRSISDLNLVPDAPSNITLQETLYEVNGDVRVKVTVAWNIVKGASSYVVSYRRDSGNPITLPQTQTNDIEILNAEPGTYEVTIWAVNPFGTKSSPGTATAKILGKALAPSNVTGFSLIPLGSVAYLSWDKSIDLDVLRGGYVRIRYTPATTSQAWKNAVDIAPALPGTSTRAEVPLLAGTYMAKFIDSSGNVSVTEATIVTTVPTPLAQNVVQTLTESPTFSGTKTNLEYSSTLSGIALSAGFLIDSITDFDTVGSFDYAGGVLSNGTYLFANSCDLGNVFTSNLTASIYVEGFDVGASFDAKSDLIDDWADVDGALVDEVNAEIFLRTTDDNPAGAPTWSPWKRFFTGQYTCRAYQFKVEVASTNKDQNLVIKTLSVVIDMPDRVEAINGLNSGAGTYSVVYSKPFNAVPSVGITAYNLNSGDYWNIINETRSGFDITFKNAATSAISRKFDVLAKGYGRQMN